MRAHALVLMLVTATGLAACGGDGGNGGGGNGGGADGGSAAVSQADAAQLFASRCGNCHTLAAAQTDGQVGPNLDELQPSRERVLTAIREGPGVMPAGLVTGDQAEAVATYVAENAGS